MFELDDKLCAECRSFTMAQPSKMKEYEMDFGNRRMQKGDAVAKV